MRLTRLILSGLVTYRGRTIRYLGGGGARVFVACKLFFYLREKTISFLAINVSQFFFYVSSMNFFVVCFPYYVRYHLVFFLVNIFLINFNNKLFFLPTFSTNFFVLTFVATNYFFQFFSKPPPPLQISNVASLDIYRPMSGENNILWPIIDIA